MRTVRAAARHAFDAQFVDVAEKAGLTAPVVYGGVETRNTSSRRTAAGSRSTITTVTDGWIFLFPADRVWTGRRQVATNRLVQEQSRWHVHGRNEKAGLERVVWVSGVTIGDYNNDGYDDLFLSCWGQNILYRNNGNGTFTDVTKKAGLLHPEPRWGAGCTFLDYNRDGYLDLFVSTYLDFD